MPHCLYCHSEIHEQNGWPIPWKGRRVYFHSDDEGIEETAKLTACSEKHRDRSLHILADAESKRGAFLFGISFATVFYPFLALAGYEFFRMVFQWTRLWGDYNRHDHAGLILFLFGIDWGGGLLLYPYPTNEPGAVLGLLRSVWTFRILGGLLIAFSIAFYFTWNLWEGY